jgi:hypothetical protein
MISIIHPTRNRFKQAQETTNKWLSRADGNIEYILSVDLDDLNYKNSSIAFISDNKSAIEAINNAAKKASGNIFIIISDDTDCPEHWDTLLLQALEGKSDFCAKTDDGLQPTLITMPIMDRIYYERYGYVYHPDFLHMHCDEELTCVALMTGKYIKLPITFLHNHYTTGKTEIDDINRKNNATWAQGQKTLNEHAKNNFGIENPVMRREDIIWK